MDLTFTGKSMKDFGQFVQELYEKIEFSTSREYARTQRTGGK
jgi:hypothetical protein